MVRPRVSSVSWQIAPRERRCSTQGRRWPKAPELPAGVHVVSPVLYETAPRSWRRGVIEEVDVVAVASPSAVRAVGALNLPWASIGPTTTAALREAGIEPWVEAAEPSFEALARAIAEQDG